MPLARCVVAVEEGMQLVVQGPDAPRQADVFRRLRELARIRRRAAEALHQVREDIFRAWEAGAASVAVAKASAQDDHELPGEQRAGDVPEVVVGGRRGRSSLQRVL